MVRNIKLSFYDGLVNFVDFSFNIQSSSLKVHISEEYVQMTWLNCYWIHISVFWSVFSACFSISCCVSVFRLTGRIPRETAASQDLKFWCRNSWRVNRCRKKWPSSFERGISVLLCHLQFSFFQGYHENHAAIIKNKSFPPLSFMHIELHKKGNTYGNQVA